MCCWDLLAAASLRSCDPWGRSVVVPAAFDMVDLHGCHRQIPSVIARRLPYFLTWSSHHCWSVWLQQGSGSCSPGTCNCHVCVRLSPYQTPCITILHPALYLVICSQCIFGVRVCVLACTASATAFVAMLHYLVAGCALGGLGEPHPARSHGLL